MYIPRRNQRYYIAKCLTRDGVFVLFIENKMPTYTVHVLGAAKRQLSILKFNFHIDILMAEASRLNAVHNVRTLSTTERRQQTLWRGW